MGVQKYSARALIARGWGVSLVSRCLRCRVQLHVILRRTDDWKYRANPHPYFSVRILAGQTAFHAGLMIHILRVTYQSKTMDVCKPASSGG